MRKLLVLGLVGLAAQLVDGSLGMAYGVTSTTLLLAAGLSPAVASASVHLAEVGTAAAAGVAHCRFGNVDWRLVRWIALPGAAGAFAGATVLGHLATDVAAPWTAGVLAVLGGYLLVRFALRPPGTDRVRPPLRTRFLAPLGMVAGFLDATGGGGWGPVATPALLSSGRMAPRTVVGSVDTSEFLVALAASAGFLVALGSGGPHWPVVAALLAGGLVAAPLAAWLVRRMPGPLLGAAVGGLILLTNARTVLTSLGVAADTRVAAYMIIVAAWAAAVTLAARAVRRDLRRRDRVAPAMAAEPSPVAEAA